MNAGLSVRLLVSLLLLFVPALLLRGTLFHVFLMLPPFCIVGALLPWVPYVFAANRWGWTSPEDSRLLKWTKHCVWLVIWSGSVSLSIIPGLHLVHAYDVRAAKEFSEVLVPRIETYRAEHGHYPQELELVLRPEDRLPQWFRRDRWVFLSASISVSEENGEAYFEILLFDSLVSNWAYDSRTKLWDYESA